MANRILRWFWGILVILSFGWLVLGFIASGDAFNQGIQEAEQAEYSGAAATGTAIGTGIGLTVFLCTGIPVLGLSGLLYWRNGVAIRRKKENEETERRHQEEIEAIRSQNQTKT